MEAVEDGRGVRKPRLGRLGEGCRHVNGGHLDTAAVVVHDNRDVVVPLPVANLVDANPAGAPRAPPDPCASPRPAPRWRPRCARRCPSASSPPSCHGHRQVGDHLLGVPGEGAAVLGPGHQLGMHASRSRSLPVGPPPRGPRGFGPRAGASIFGGRPRRSRGPACRRRHSAGGAKRGRLLPPPRPPQAPPW